MCLVLFLPRLISLCYLVRDTYGAVKLPSKKACPSLLRHHQIRLKQSKNKKIERFFFSFSCTENIWWKSLRYLNASKGFATISLLYLVKKKAEIISQYLLFLLQVSEKMCFIINLMYKNKIQYCLLCFCGTALKCTKMPLPFYSGASPPACGKSFGARTK